MFLTCKGELISPRGIPFLPTHACFSSHRFTNFQMEQRTRTWRGPTSQPALTCPTDARGSRNFLLLLRGESDLPSRRTTSRLLTSMAWPGLYIEGRGVASLKKKSLRLWRNLYPTQNSKLNENFSASSSSLVLGPKSQNLDSAFDITQKRRNWNHAIDIPCHFHLKVTFSFLLIHQKKLTNLMATRF